MGLGVKKKAYRMTLLFFGSSSFSRGGLEKLGFSIEHERKRVKKKYRERDRGLRS